MRNIVSDEKITQTIKEIVEMLEDIDVWKQRDIDIGMLNGDELRELNILVANVWIFFYTRYVKQTH